MKIAIVKDSGCLETLWSKTWTGLCDKNEIPYQCFDSWKENFMASILDYQPDIVLWRSGQQGYAKRKDMFQRFTLEKHARMRIYPDWNTHYLYENKIMQTYQFQIKGIPHPETHIFFIKQEAQKFLQGATFPLVIKANEGAGSRSTRFIENLVQGKKQLEECFGEGLVYHKDKRERDIFYAQEYVPAPGIFRIVMIGTDIGYSFYQSNRPGTIIASSQGFDSYPPTPTELLDISSEINKRMQWDWMMYDFIYKKATKQWLILELTDTCGRGHSEKRTLTHYLRNGKWESIESNTSPQELIFNKYVGPQPSKQLAKSIVKPRIMAFLDDKDWCFWTTGNAIVERLKDDFEFTLGHTGQQGLTKWEGDLVWCRGQIWRADTVTRVLGNRKSLLFTFTACNEERVKKIAREGQYKEAVGAVVLCNRTAGMVKDNMPDLKTWLIPNGVDTKKFSPGKPPKRFTVGYVGGVLPSHRDFHKGFSHLVNPACEKTDIKLVCASSNIKHRVKFEKMPEFYRQCSCLLLPTISEGCSNSIMEAMACGLPVLTTRTAGYHGEACKDKDNIIFVERDTKDIIQKLTWLKENPVKAQKIGNKARDFALKHDWSIVIENYRQMFWEALNRVAGKQKILSGWCEVEVLKPIGYRGRKNKGDKVEMPTKIARGFGSWIKILKYRDVGAPQTKLQEILMERGEIG